MASIIEVKLTKEHLALISNIRHKNIPENHENMEYPNMAIDMNSLYGGDFLLEDISFIIGCYDKRYKGSEEYAMGPEFPEDVTNHMLDLHCYIMKNLENIEELVHYYSNKGGLTEGTYRCNEWEHIWEKIEK